MFVFLGKLELLESSDEELPECVDDHYDLPKNDDEWIDTISSTRLSTYRKY